MTQTTDNGDDAASSMRSRLSEALDSLWDRYVDPREALAGDGEGWWAPVGVVGSNPLAPPDLAQLRDECRRLAMSNEFAVNGHENRVSYLVGPGHTYLATVCKGCNDPGGLAMRVQHVIDEFLDENDWGQRQQEIVRRMDRDGEAFLRLFPASDGRLRVRFLEPEEVATPPSALGDPAASHGVLCDPSDVETVRGYYVGGRLVDASLVQHRRANVDRNVKRGLPLYTPVRKNLRRAEKLLRNMSALAEVQSAIALIRKHRSATRAGVERFVADQAAPAPVENRGRRLTDYGPGTILDAPAGLEYSFPATGIDASSYVRILQAELRAIAARLVMPEFMLTSDASNANYASTMVAEGPAVKMFQRLQATLVADDRRLIRGALRAAVAAGRLPEEALSIIEVQIAPPSLAVRDRLEEARIDELAYRHGVLSRQTWSQRLGFDYEQEQRNRRADEQGAGGRERA